MCRTYMQMTIIDEVKEIVIIFFLFYFFSGNKTLRL
jgi:hypothetical protein